MKNNAPSDSDFSDDMFPPVPPKRRVTRKATKITKRNPAKKGKKK